MLQFRWFQVESPPGVTIICTEERGGKIMTTTNMCSNFGGKWDSSPYSGFSASKYPGVVWDRALYHATILYIQTTL